MATDNTPLINYTSRDFEALRTDLINYVKTRHPDKMSYFNDASSDMIYLEMLSYIGDNLNFQIDKSFNENFRTTAQNRDAILRIADSLGYYDYFAKPSLTQANISIDVPATTNENGSAIIPHPAYLVSLYPGTIVKANNGAKFECTEEINFANEQMRTVVPNYDSNGFVKNFTVTKTVRLISGEIKYQRFYVNSDNLKPFLEIVIDDTEVTDVVSIVEMPGNIYEIPTDDYFRDYNEAFLPVGDLSEDKIFVALNTNDNDDYELTQIINAYTDMSINYGKWINKPKRFIVRRDKFGRAKIIFGNSVINRETWNDLVGSIDLSAVTNFTINQVLNNSVLGVMPQVDTTLFIKYRSGAGIKTNINENEIKDITYKSFKPTSGNYDEALLARVKQSLKVSSNIPAIGGTDELTNEEIKQNLGIVFSANNRIVTYDDVVAMIKKMPPSFGQPFRVSYEEIKPKVLNYAQINNYVSLQLAELSTLTMSAERSAKIAEINKFMTELPSLPVDKINEKLISYQQSTEAILSNTPSLWLGEKCNLYVLGIDKEEKPVGVYKDQNGIFRSANTFLKNNIKEFMINKKIIGDYINIVDANVINFQVEFKIIADEKNKQKVLMDCLNRMRAYFNVYNWNINQPIFVSNVQTILQEVEGVVNVVDLKFYNIFGENKVSGKLYEEPEIGTYYNNENISTTLQNNRFLMKTVNNIILSRPNDMFHVRYPNDDIIGSVL